MDKLGVRTQPAVEIDPPRSYEETELGLLPEGWTIRRLGDVVRLRSEGVSPQSAPHLPYIGLEHIDPGDPKLRRHGVASEVKSGKSRFYPGDVLYGKLRPYLDKAALAEREGMCSTDILVLDRMAGVDPSFLSNLVHTRRFRT